MGMTNVPGVSGLTHAATQAAFKAHRLVFRIRVCPKHLKLVVPSRSPKA